MCAGHIGEVIWMDNIIEAEAAHLPVAEAQHLSAPRVKGHDGEVKLVLGLEHDLLLGHLEEGGRPKGRADAEEGEGRVLRLAVLTMEGFDSTSDVQALKRRGRRSSKWSSRGKREVKKRSSGD